MSDKTAEPARLVSAPVPEQGYATPANLIDDARPADWWPSEGDEGNPFGVTPAELEQSRGRHPSAAVVTGLHPSYAQYAALAESNAATAGAVGRARHARCEGCGCACHRHRGDLGCLDCECTHPTGVV